MNKLIFKQIRKPTYNRILYLFVLFWIVACQQKTSDDSSFSNNEFSQPKILLTSFSTADSSWYHILDSIKGLSEQNSHIALKRLDKVPIDEFTDTELQAKFLHEKGVRLFILEQYKEAINVWRKSLGLRLSQPAWDTTNTTKGFRNIGYTHFLLENYQFAKDSLSLAFDIYSNFSSYEEKRLGDIKRELGLVHLALGDIHQAELQIPTAFKLSESLDTWDRGQFFNACFNLYYRKRGYSKAMSYANEGLLLYQHINGKIMDDSLQIATSYNNIGLVLQEQLKLEDAIFTYKQAAAIHEIYQYQTEDIARNLGANYFNIAELYLVKQEFQLALEFVEKAIEVEEGLEANIGIAKNYDLKAKILEKQGNRVVALVWNQKALQRLVPELKDDAIPSPQLLTPYKSDLIRSLSNRANILQQSQSETNLLLASAVYDSTSLFIEQLRLNYESDQTKAFLTNDAKRIFQSAVDLHIQLYKKIEDPAYLAKAFEYTERSKAIILLDALNDSEAKQYANVSNDVLEKERQLKKQIAKTEKALFHAPDSLDMRLRNQLFVQNRALEEFILRLEQQYPDYAKLKYSNTSISLETIQTQLEETVVSYFLGEEQDYVFLLNKDKLEVVELGKSDKLLQWVEDLRQGLFGKQTIGRNETATYDSIYIQAAQNLYQHLFQPLKIACFIPKQIVIIPDGFLGYVPFESLLMSSPEEIQHFGSHNYLIKEHQISYCYSTALLQEMKNKQHAKPSQKTLIFEPEFGIHSKDKLAPIASNAKDLNTIIHSKVIKKQEATLSAFTQEASHYQLIYLGTHGLANDTIGDRGYLAFTFLPDGIDNEFLYTRDLYNLQLNADMVVLSACETGIGELQAGEGIISLARGFSYAGAKSIITTLWSVKDESTNELLQSFYTYIKEGKTKDDALRQAKLDFIETNWNEARPFYWAGFIGVGDMSSLELKSAFQWWWIILLLPIITFFIWRIKT